MPRAAHIWIDICFFLFVLNSSSGLLRSGEFLPLEADSGFLACPQSLTTKQGLGYCIGVVPLGAAVVISNSTGADIFLQCVAQRVGPEYGRPYGASVMYRYPYRRMDPETGARNLNDVGPDPRHLSFHT